MSQRCVIADAFKFASEGRELQGSIEVARLDRLSDLLERMDGTVSYRVSGGQGADGRWQLGVVASGTLILKCQRCLTPLDWPFEIDSALWLVRSAADIPEEELEDETRDAIEVTPDMDVEALVEDEILLAVPVVPRHDKCEAPLPLGGAGKESPFAALAGLTKPAGSRGAD